MQKQSKRVSALAMMGALAVTAGSLAGAPAASAESNAPYLVGAGIYDITGAVAETGAFGYAANQEMNGLQERLYSHAYVMGDPKTGKRVVFVSADAGAMFQSVKLGVVNKLKAKYGSRYVDSNVMLSATHTHVANSGQSHDKLYQIAGADKSGSGYDQRNFDAMVNGIVASIERADANVEPGNISVTSGNLSGATKNRSAKAYEANKDAGSFDSNVNETMTVLKLTSASGQPVGMINWFSTHPTQFSKDTTHISGDTKGRAQYEFEKKMKSDPTKAKTFVAAFASSDEGDVVSTQGNSKSAPGFGGSSDDFVNTEIDGMRQYTRGEQLWNGPSTPVTGPIDSRGRWANFADYTVKGEYTQGAGDKKLCKPARGWSFAAGAENGPSDIPGIYEGMTKGSFSVTDKYNKIDTSALGGLTRFALASLTTILGADDACQEEKAVLLPDGKLGMAPTAAPVQILRIGNVALVGVPAEATTMSGRRIRAEVSKQLAGTGVDNVVVAGLTNSYMGYLTTREEYAKQHYEGASTEFGPNQLGAFLQEYSGLAKAMRDGTGVSNQVTPTTKSGGASRAGVVLDDKPLSQSFGQALTQPKASYSRGETATAVFRGGHPKNDFRTQRSFLEVQRKEGSQWVTYLTDRDWDTSYTWKREGASYSRTTVDWRIRGDVPAGTYRLVQTGDWKNGWNGKVSPYTGTSQEFTVN